MVIQLLFWWCLTANATITGQKSPSGNGSSISSPIRQLVGEDDPRFGVQVLASETKLPATPLLMNVVELMARYAEMDFLSRTPRRSGTVLPQFPQIEIAVLPAPPARSVEVRLLVWAIYATVIDMVYGGGFYESEVAVFWDDVIKAHVYFTLPMDDHLRAKYQIKIPTSDNNTALQENTNSTVQPVNTVFEWHPIYRPDGKNLLPRDIFVLVLGAIKVIAPHRVLDQVPGPMDIVSNRVDANLQVILDRTHLRRPVPPFLRFGHALEAVRRIPGWQLERHKFAEFFASIEINRRPVAVILLEKGPMPAPGNGNVTTV
ncbi:MAG: hypothetical protein LQ352_002010 [Teloschistes flavicans]|nr:MAG: hypothetical protein LQ352_002010 [Teloschistes flavicans]